jgi:hypothetical protein
VRDCNVSSIPPGWLVAHRLVVRQPGNQEGLQPVPQVQGRCPLTRPAATRLQAFLISFMDVRTGATNVSRRENVELVDSLTT